MSYRIFLVAIFSFILMATSLYGAGPAHPASKGSISGTVTDEELDFLSGVSVTTVPHTADVVTDELGSFYIGKVPEGNYTILFSKKGYEITKIEDVRVTKNATSLVTAKLKYRDAGTIFLSPLEPPPSKGTTMFGLRGLINTPNTETYEKNEIFGSMGYIYNSANILKNKGKAGFKIINVGYGISDNFNISSTTYFRTVRLGRWEANDYHSGFTAKYRFKRYYESPHTYAIAYEKIYDSLIESGFTYLIYDFSWINMYLDNRLTIAGKIGSSFEKDSRLVLGLELKNYRAEFPYSLLLEGEQNSSGDMTKITTGLRHARFPSLMAYFTRDFDAVVRIAGMNFSFWYW